MRLAARLFQRFGRFPFWSQVAITLGSVAILVALWSACGANISMPSRPPLSSPRTELRGRYGAVMALAFSPAGEWLAAATSDRNVRLWDVSKGEVIRAMKGHGDLITSLAVSVDGKILATGSADKTVKLWDTSTGNEIRTFTGHTGGITSVAFSPDGHWLASSSSDGSVIIWDVSSGKQLRSFTGHTGRTNTIAVSSDGLLLAADDDKTVRLWNPQTGELVCTLAGNESRILSVAFSPDSKFLATGTSLGVGLRPTHQGEIRLWNVENGRVEHSFQQAFGNVLYLAFSPDGKTLTSVTESVDAYTNSQLTFWDAKKLTVLSQFDAERRGQLRAIAYSPDGRWLASGGSSGRIRLWQ
jgi:WD40 repeat protein